MTLLLPPWPPTPRVQLEWFFFGGFIKVGLQLWKMAVCEHCWDYLLSRSGVCLGSVESWAVGHVNDVMIYGFGGLVFNSQASVSTIALSRRPV